MSIAVLNEQKSLSVDMLFSKDLGGGLQVKRRSMYQETYVSRNTWKTAEVSLAAKISLSHKSDCVPV